MADINEAEVWESGIYQLETTDPVEGGVDGVDNLPHKHLANRTVWLKAQLDKIFSGTTVVYNSERLGGKDLEEVKTYIIDALVDGAGDAYNTLLGLQNEIQNNDGDISGILTTLSHKANEYGDSAKTFAVADADSENKAPSLGQTRREIASNLNRTIYVDASIGNDAGDWRGGEPVRTIGRALALSIGGMTTIWLTPDQTHVISARHAGVGEISIRANGTVYDDTRPVIDFGTDGGILTQHMTSLTFGSYHREVHLIDSTSRDLNKQLIDKTEDGTRRNACFVEICHSKVTLHKARLCGLQKFLRLRSTDILFDDADSNHSLLYVNDTMSFDVSGGTFKNIDGSADLSYVSKIENIIRDGGSGNPVNIVSNINFSS